MSRGKFEIVSEFNDFPHCDHLAIVFNRLAYYYMAKKEFIVKRVVD